VTPVELGDQTQPPIVGRVQVTREFRDLSFQLTQRQHRLLTPTGFVHDRLSMAVYLYSILLEPHTSRQQKKAHIVRYDGGRTDPCERPFRS
jgi:hypothetical protein